MGIPGRKSLTPPPHCVCTMSPVTVSIAILLVSSVSAVDLLEPQAVSWFTASGPQDSCNITEGRTVVPGPLDDSICRGSTPGSSQCACVSSVGSTPSNPSYTRLCGSCFDPCALHFHVDHTDHNEE